MTARLRRFVVGFVVFALLGVRIGLVRFWVFGAILIGFVAYVTSSADPSLMRERIRPGGPTADRGALLAIRLAGFGALVITIVDIGWTHWSDTLPTSVHVAAMSVYAAAMLLLSRAMMANRFFSPAVRIQSERGHRVVSSGPYAVVRHPGYLAMMVLVLAATLALGSWYGLALAVLYAALIGRRAAVEDRYLRTHLDGYAAYTERVRYRLIPRIW